MKTNANSTTRREIRPSAGDTVYQRVNGQHRMSVIGEVVECVSYPRRWVVYDRRGNVHQVEPVGLGSWMAVTGAVGEGSPLHGVEGR